MYKQRLGVERETVITAREIQFADHWHLVRVGGNKVFDAAHLLRIMGLKIYAPLQTYNKRYGRNRMKSIEVEATHPAFFNYLFVGFRRRADWWAMFETGYIRSIVVSAGAPVRFTQGEIAAVAIRQARGDFDFRGRVMRAAVDLKPGDIIRVENERHCLYGREYRVEAVQDGRVCVMLDILGKKQVHELTVDDVSKSK
ncbi:transcription termination/antitermination protein NusG [Hyphococcus sp.]|uniref:transcription termination/antitermination protein NusG n=1 Tax=Hyphococcus sp. TaxID=2038636 RepID=UPI00208C8544|nr:MAG: hypothetical protein DHS20C04_31910 [Marinicaulis sp.]